jgi:tetratricopeptide (TPR) repeat protein
VARAGRQLLAEFSPWLALLPLIGAWLAREQRRLVLATLIPAVVTFVYAVNYDIPWEIEVYFIPLVLVLALWSAGALAWVARRMGRARAVLPLILLLPLVQGWKENDRSEHRVILALGQDLFASTPRGATLIVPERDATFALLYLQAVEGARPDVAVWVSAAPGAKPLARAVDPELAPLPLVEVVNAAKGPVASYERISPEALPGWQAQPHGALYWLHRKDAPAPSVAPEPARLELEAFVTPRPSFFLDEPARSVLASYALVTGDAEMARRRPDAARARYLAAAELGGELAWIQCEIGTRFAELGETELAVDWLQKSSAARDDALAENRLGRALVGLRRLDEALAAFTRATRIDPTSATARSNRGGCLAMLGREEEALAEFREAVELDPRNVMARNNLAQARLLAGDREEALAEWRASLALDPTQADVRRRLEELGEKP